MAHQPHVQPYQSRCNPNPNETKFAGSPNGPNGSQKWIVDRWRRQVFGPNPAKTGTGRAKVQQSGNAIGRRTEESYQTSPGPPAPLKSGLLSDDPGEICAKQKRNRQLIAPIRSQSSLFLPVSTKFEICRKRRVVCLLCVLCRERPPWSSNPDFAIEAYSPNHFRPKATFAALCFPDPAIRILGVPNQPLSSISWSGTTSYDIEK